MRFSYCGPGTEIGVTRATLDAHGRPLIPPRTVPANSPEAAHKFTSGKVFDVDERKEPVLHWFLSIDRNFQRME
jgi:hypothetical protein